MTREEEINNASYAYWVNNYANIEFIDEEEKELHTQDIQESFINGAEWADSHPHWISAEDELPKEKGWILAVAGDVDMFDYEGESAIVLKDMYHITHWMPLPQAPSSSEKPNNCEKGGEE